jgi:5S rRNA maturation endonuclease (ribonuclease M5)
MPLPPSLRRVSRDQPCPICGKKDWCVVEASGELAFCCRVDEGATKYIDRLEAWEHPVTGKEIRKALRKYCVKAEIDNPPTIDAAALAAEYAAAITGNHIGELSQDLGVSEAALLDMGVGWSEAHLAYTFPMVNAAREPIGIRLRSISGKKWAVRGSRSGLFVPRSFAPSEHVYICEGPTDTAAMLDLGFEAIGRPACRGGGSFIRSLLRSFRGCVVVMADSDGPGVQGAEALCEELVSMRVASVCMIQPDRGKDVRQWKNSGVTSAEIIFYANNAPNLRHAPAK